MYQILSESAEFYRHMTFDWDMVSGITRAGVTCCGNWWYQPLFPPTDDPF